MAAGLRESSPGWPYYETLEHDVQVECVRVTCSFIGISGHESSTVRSASQQSSFAVMPRRLRYDDGLPVPLRPVLKRRLGHRST